MEKKRNCSIDIFRYFCAVLIVVIHTSLFSDINTGLSDIFVNILPRIAVPFFFAVSGYYYIGKLEQGKKAFAPYIKKLVITYTVWSVIYFVWDFILWGHKSIKGFAASSLRTFFLDGSHYHLWFMVGLIISVCVVTLFYKLKMQKLLIPIGIILAVFGCLSCAYSVIGDKIPLFNNLLNWQYFLMVRRYLFTGLPFFILGLAVRKLQVRVNSLSIKSHWAIVACAVAVWIVEIILVRKLNLENGVTVSAGLFPLTGAVLLLLFRCPAANQSKAASVCKPLSGFTYYSHALVIEIIAKTVDLPTVPTFIITVAATAVLGLAIYKLNNKYLNILAN